MHLKFTSVLLVMQQLQLRQSRQQESSSLTHIGRHFCTPLVYHLPHPLQLYILPGRRFGELHQILRRSPKLEISAHRKSDKRI